MSSSRSKFSVIQNRKERLDSRWQAFENDIRRDFNVTCRQNFNEYLNNSSLHGLRYVGDRSISRWER